jgi:acetyl-CoA decarbonylase/synthase complex subunit epsilon
MAAGIVDTTKRAVPFDKANIPGPKTAKPIKAEIAGKLISKATRPLLIVGTSAANEGIPAYIRIMADKGMPVAATGSSLGQLKKEGINAVYINLHALVTYLKDPEWSGFDGSGNYDTAIFLGHTYYYASQLMSILKNFSSIKVISIDRHYHPNASISFGNLKKEEFLQALEIVTDQL